MQTLEVAIGLSLVYLMLSLVCTAANEFLAQWFNSRATTLKEGIDSLLRDVTEPISAAADQLAAAEARRAQVAKEAEVAAHAPAEHAAWAAAVGAAEDATLAFEQACVQARSVASDQSGAVASAIAQAMAGPGGQSHEAALGAARTLMETTATARVSASAALDGVRPGAAAMLLALRKAAGSKEALLKLGTLYAHPLITGLSQLPWRLLPWDDKVRIPSYIPTQTFTLALLDTIAPASSGSPTPLLEIRRALAHCPDHVRRPLLLSLNEAGGNVDKFRQHLALWYDNTMDRVSGLYKRKTKLTVLMFAVLVTLFTNADTVRIVRALSSDKALRDALVSQAEATVRSPTANTPPAAAAAEAAAAPSEADRRQAFEKSLTDLRALGIPLGYAAPDSALAAQIAQASWIGSPSRISAYIRLYAPQLRDGFIGLLLTALALSLGAPFWFDILNKVVNVRAVGRTPQENARNSTAPPATK